MRSYHDPRAAAPSQAAALPVVPDGCVPSYHLFHVLLADRRARDGLIAHLAARGISAVFHYSPLHSSPMGRRYGYVPDDLPVSERSSERIVRLPLYPGLGKGDQSQVVEAIEEFVTGRS